MQRPQEIDHRQLTAVTGGSPEAKNLPALPKLDRSHDPKAPVVKYFPDGAAGINFE